VARHFSSPRKSSVHRRDVAALVELATLARECGARADLASDAELAQEFGRLTEFCVGGPGGNSRTETHLRTLLPGVTFRPPGDDPATLVVGDAAFPCVPGIAEFVILARAFGPAGGKPVFLLAGQTAPTNLAAARHLDRKHRELFRAHGADRPFCLVLRIVEPAVYGIDFTEVVADVSDVAFAAPATE
jgi:hypothetical protein